MNLANLDSFPNSSQIWIYGFTKPLDQSSRETIRETLQAFCSDWNSHGVPVSSGFVFLDDRFVVLVADGSREISGCSIDSSVRVFKDLRDACELDGMDRSLVFFRDGKGETQAAPYQRFQARVDNGEVGMETPVFDTTLRHLGELREGLFEVPVKESWHARSFSISA